MNNTVRKSEMQRANRRLGSILGLVCLGIFALYLFSGWA